MDNCRRWAFKYYWNGKTLILGDNQFKDILPLVRFDKIKGIKQGKMLITTSDSGLVELDLATLKYNVFTKENGIPSDTIIDVLTLDNRPMIVSDAGIALYNKEFNEIPALSQN